MSDQVDNAPYEVLVEMRNHMKHLGPRTPEQVDGLTDSEVLNAFDQDYPQGARGFMHDIGASVDDQR